MDSTQLNDPIQRRSILVIDDEPNGLRLLVQLLTQAGYDAEVAFGADDALRKLGRRCYDMAIVELAMKQFSGIRLIEIIKSSPLGAGIPVLAITAPIRRSLMQPLGCDGFIFRPVDPNQLVSALDEARSIHRQLRNPSVPE